MSGADVTFRPILLWRILDFNITKISTSVGGGLQEVSGVPNGNPHATLHISTNFVHPLVEPQAGLETGSRPAEDVDAGIRSGDEYGGNLFLDNFFFDYLLTDPSWPDVGMGMYES